MSKLMFIKNYNNYFNRIVKVDTTFTGYTTRTFTGMNFNPNDDVTTEHTINWDETWMPDYVIVYDDSNNLISRWFIMEAIRTRKNQYIFQLKRDLVADYYNKVVGAPMIVDRAMISNSDNPLLFNSEGFSFNQIKNQEILLKDRTRSPWYILYFNKNVSSKSGYFSTEPRSYDDAISVAIDDNASPYKSGTYTYIDNQYYRINYNGMSDGIGSTYYAQYTINTENRVKLWTTNNHNDYRWFYDNPAKIFPANDEWVASKFRTALTVDKIPTLNGYLQNTYQGDFIDSTKFEKLSGSRSLVVKSDSNGVVKYYQVNISISSYNDTKYHTGGDCYNYVVNLINGISGLYHNEIDNKTIESSCTLYTITVSTTEISGAGELVWELDFANHTSCKDAPYHILAIPKYNTNFISNYTGGGWDFVCPQEINDALVNSIISEYGTGGNELIDVQLLPYFPYENKVPYIGLYEEEDFVSTSELDSPGTMLDVGSEHHWRRYSGQTVVTDQLGWDAPQYSLFGKHGEGKCSAIFYVDQATFSFDITANLPIKQRSNKDYLNKKLSNELDLYRLCSPNYNGVFEYSNAKNDGTDLFNVDVTLRPFNPYIHLNPNFKGLYGNDYNDSRGLICQGDFSLPMINDQWKTYELQNKNYLNSFNRQIEHMEFEQKQEKTLGIVNAIVGGVTGTTAGAAGGAMVGGPVGAAVGGAVGAIGSTVGGIADLMMMDERHQENLAYSKDAFRYQLGNIKALPQTVTKVTCLTANNKLWPFIEVYSASETEQSILENKINYTSMNVSAIGTISDYLQSNKSFIAGTLIRLEDLGLAYHEAVEIYKEIKQGVYI